MEKLESYGNKLRQICNSCWFFLKYFYRYLLLRSNSLMIHIFYFIFFSILGFLLLVSFKTRTAGSYTPSSLDMFFTSVSATTVSSMGTVEMEVFSDTQLVILTVLMFIGSEVFTSMAGLHFQASKLQALRPTGDDKVSYASSDPELELGDMGCRQNKFFPVKIDYIETEPEFLRFSSTRFLGYVVLGYLMVIHVIGVALVSLYFVLISSAKRVLESKGLKLFTFSVFTTVSTFASCGFVPTNENMVVFRKNSGLLLLLVPQALLGNTLFPTGLRYCVWVLGKFMKRRESEYLMKNPSRVGYHHWLSRRHSWFLVLTVFVFIAAQMVLFCAMDWSSDELSGLSAYERAVGTFFESVNSRHTGETIVDISVISRAVLVLFVVMMYLPPYTSFLPVKDEEIDQQKHEKRSKKDGAKFVENLIFSQLSYLSIFVILVCITEREKMTRDPLNFNVLNIIVEVTSAYGNVGFTTGYSCARQIEPDGKCVDKLFGLVGKWSDEGKIILILVMFFGRLKKFNLNGGKAWILM